MKSKKVSVDEAAALLNELLGLDKAAITRLCVQRVPCNKALALHPTVQVLTEDKKYLVGMLGILNGLFGKQQNNRGYLSAAFDSETGELISFVVTRPEHKA